MERFVIALALAAVAAGFALWIQKRKSPGPTESIGEFKAPSTLDRSDFARPDAPWLVAVFTSATCSTCADVWTKAKALQSPQVEVQQVEEKSDSAIHRLYDIRAVPITVIADSEGRVRASFMGPVSATHLWAGLAELRDPGSGPSGCGESAAGPNLDTPEINTADIDAASIDTPNIATPNIATPNIATDGLPAGE